MKKTMTLRTWARVLTKSERFWFPMLKLQFCEWNMVKQHHFSCLIPHSLTSLLLFAKCSMKISHLHNSTFMLGSTSSFVKSHGCDGFWVPVSDDPSQPPRDVNKWLPEEWWNLLKSLEFHTKSSVISGPSHPMLLHAGYVGHNDHGKRAVPNKKECV